MQDISLLLPDHELCRPSLECTLWLCFARFMLWTDLLFSVMLVWSTSEAMVCWKSIKKQISFISFIIRVRLCPDWEIKATFMIVEISVEVFGMYSQFWFSLLYIFHYANRLMISGMLFWSPSQAMTCWTKEVFISFGFRLKLCCYWEIKSYIIVWISVKKVINHQKLHDFVKLIKFALWIH